MIEQWEVILWRESNWKEKKRILINAHVEIMLHSSVDKESLDKTAVEC